MRRLLAALLVSSLSFVAPAAAAADVGPDGEPEAQQAADLPVQSPGRVLGDPITGRTDVLSARSAGAVVGPSRQTRTTSGRSAAQRPPGLPSAVRVTPLAEAGETTWNVSWTQPGDTGRAPLTGCKGELFRASDGRLVSTISTVRSACTGILFDTPGVALDPNRAYYAKVSVFNGGWGPAVTTAAAYPIHTPGISLAASLGNCDCPGSTGRQAGYQVLRGDPVNTATGSFSESVSDARVSAPGKAFDLTRTYNSADPAVGPLGRGWSFPYNATLTVLQNSVLYRAEDGQQITFTVEGNGFLSPPGVRSVLTRLSSGYALTTPEHDVLSFNVNGRLISWLDASGAGLQFTRDTQGRLTGIRDASGHAFTLTYSGERLTQVNFPVGRSVKYAYTGEFLTAMTDPRGFVTNYEYAGGLLTKVRGPKGQYLTQNTYTNQKVTTQIDAVSGQWKFEYLAGQTRTTDPRGMTWRDFYSGNVLTRSVDPMGNATDYGYDDELRVTSVTDATGGVTRMSYDEAGRLVTRTAPSPLSFVERFEYSTAGDLVRVTDRRGLVTSNTYDTKHRLITSTDAALGQHRYEYTDLGLVRVMTSPEGRRTTYEYDTAGQRTAVVSPLGNRTGYSYDSSGRLVSTTDPRGMSASGPTGYTTSLAYDAADNVLSVTDPRGFRTVFGYDEVGDRISVTDPQQRVTTFTYDPAHRQLTATDPKGRRVTRQYDRSGNLITWIDAIGARTTYVYSANNWLRTTVPPRGNAINPDTYSYTFSYDAKGNRTTVRDPLAATTITSYDALNRPVSVKDPVGHVKTSRYDGNGNLVETRDAMHRSVRRTYDSLNHLVSVADERKSTTRFVYDRDGNQTAKVTPGGSQYTSTYDDDGRILTQTDPRGNAPGGKPADYTRHFTYDPAGNPTSVKDPLGAVTTRAFDASGNLVQEIDARGAVTKYEYDALNRPWSVTDAVGGLTRYTYDEVGDLVTRTDAKNHAVHFTYDAAHRLNGQDDALGNKRTYLYDWNGNHIETVTARGTATPTLNDNRIRYTYDRRDVLTKADYSDATPDVTYTYDPAGHLTSMTDGAGTETYWWDILDRLGRVTRGKDVFSYAYDVAGNLVYRDSNRGGHQTYEYDADGRRVRQFAGGKATTFSYDPAGHLTRTLFPTSNGYDETRTYDRAGRLAHIRSTPIRPRPGQQTLTRFSITRDLNGNPVRIDSTLDGTEQRTSFGYDSLDRLIAACTGPACPAAGSARSWTYDAVGNRLTSNVGGLATAYSYDAADRLISQRPANGPEVTYAYDPDGNQTRAGTVNNAWDLASRLTQVRDSATGTSATYSYDGWDNRITSSAGAHSYLWDSNGDRPVLAADTAAASGTRWFAYDPTGAPVASGIGTGYDTSYHHDWRGSTAALTNGTGAAQESYAYGEFGETTNSGDSANPLKFIGEFEDPYSGLYNLRSRQYQPATGRLLSPDPAPRGISEPAVSAYVHAANRPTVREDPSRKCGLFSWAQAGFQSGTGESCSHEGTEATGRAHPSAWASGDVRFADQAGQWALQEVESARQALKAQPSSKVAEALLDRPAGHGPYPL